MLAGCSGLSGTGDKGYISGEGVPVEVAREDRDAPVELSGTDLDGQEAASLGAVLARTTATLKQATGAELVYLYVFGGGIPHLHIHLATHRAGDALNTQIIRGEVVEERLPSGAGRITSLEFPPLPEAELRAAADRVRDALK